MTSVEERIVQRLNTLAGEIGCRHSGTPGNLAAAAYLADEMRALGLEVEEQRFEIPTWAVEEQYLKAAGQELAVYANPYSPSCAVEAELAAVGTLAELEQAHLGGKIAVLYGDLTRAPISAKSWFLTEERDRRIMELLEANPPAVILAVQAAPGSTNRIFEDWEFLLPSATLPAESGRVVLLHTGERAEVRLRTVSGRGMTANIIGHRQGTRPETLVLCAHYDTKVDTPGANDNAAGVAAMLAAAELLRGDELDCNLELVAFTNEEYLPIGDDTYLERRGEGFLDRVLMAINFDGPGHILDVNSLASFTCSAEFQAEVEAVSRAYPAMQWVEPWPQSNHSTFAMRGVPALAFSSRAIWLYSHQHDDSLRWVHPPRLVECAQLTADIIRRMHDRPLGWMRPEAAAE